MTLEQIEENEETIFKKALEIDPNLLKASDRPSTKPTSHVSQQPSKKSKSGCIAVLALLIFIIVLITIKLF